MEQMKKTMRLEFELEFARKALEEKKDVTLTQLKSQVLPFFQETKSLFVDASDVSMSVSAAPLSILVFV